MLGSYAALIALAYLCFFVHAGVVYSSAVWLLGGLSPLKFFKGMQPAMLFASAGIPVECVAVAAGIDRIIDMGRTVMSVTGDASCAVVMQKRMRRSSP
ncbi:MAG: cation:dicarboxylase symporter family transporter [Bacteroidales bacterium]|nr:cation:dicarboxylase symporter family transporter [Bacteroidales bacterium]